MTARRLLIAALLPWLVLGLFLRLVGLGQTDLRRRVALFPRFPEFYEPDPNLGWVLKPSLTWTGTDFVAPFSTDRLGNRTTPAASPGSGSGGDGGPPLVHCIGDSSTFGYGAIDTDTYPAVLARLLGASIPSPPRSVVHNRGVPGYNSLSAALIAERSEEKARVSLLMVGFNDHFPSPRTAAEDYWVRKTAYACFATRTCNLLFGLVTARERPLDTPPARMVPTAAPEEYRQYLRRAVRALRERDSEPILLVYPSILSDESTRKAVAEYWKQPRQRVDANIDSHPLYQQITREVALVERTQSVDLAAIFDAAGNESLHLDWVHPNAAGYALIARAVEPAVRAALALRAGAE